MRRQQADEMASEDRQDADMEAVAADKEQAAPQQLAGAGAPGILFAVEADHAANEEDAERHIGVEAKENLIEIVEHSAISHRMWRTPRRRVRLRRRRGRTRSSDVGSKTPRPGPQART